MDDEDKNKVNNAITAIKSEASDLVGFRLADFRALTEGVQVRIVHRELTSGPMGGAVAWTSTPAEW